MRAPFEIIRDWRAAMRDLGGMTMRSDEWSRQRAIVDKLRVEYLESFDRMVGRTVSRPHDDRDLAPSRAEEPEPVIVAEASGGLLSLLEEVRLLEEHKRTLPVGTDEFNRLAVEVEQMLTQLLEHSRVQRDVGDRLATKDVTTEDLEAAAKSATPGRFGEDQARSVSPPAPAVRD